MTFYELCRQEKATPEEQENLAWILAIKRAKATWEECRPSNATIWNHRRKTRGQSARAAAHDFDMTGADSLVVEL